MKAIFRKIKVNQLHKIFIILTSLSLVSSHIGLISFAIMPDTTFFNSQNQQFNSQENLLNSKDYLLGGSYDEVFDDLHNFVSKNPSQCNNYTVHRLISKQALNKFAAYIHGLGIYNDDKINFLIDEEQYWIPSIIMAVEDYNETRSYINEDIQSADRYLSAMQFINSQYEDLRDYGNFKELLKDELNYINNNFNFNGKYDKAIKQVDRYINILGFTRVSGYIKFHDPYSVYSIFYYKPRYFC